MKRIVMILTLVLLVGGAGILGWRIWGNSQSSTASGQGYEMITSSQLISALKDKKDLQIIDLREPSLYEKAHIPGAINIPFQDFKERINEVSTTIPVVFVCHTGSMGDVASQMMVDRGVKNVSNLQGGMKAWNGPTTQ